jgi:maleylpyruvate isomerase
LRDDEFDRPSLLPGWARAHVIAHVGYQARSLARLIECARIGDDHSLGLFECEAADIALGSTLPPRALRHLFDHAAKHLNVEWRDLTDEQWNASVGGVRLRDTPWLRARETWLHTVYLSNSGSFADFPPDLLERLLPELAAESNRPGPSSTAYELAYRWLHFRTQPLPFVPHP